MNEIERKKSEALARLKARPSTLFDLLSDAFDLGHEAGSAGHGGGVQLDGTAAERLNAIVSAVEDLRADLRVRDESVLGRLEVAVAERDALSLQLASIEQRLLAVVQFLGIQDEPVVPGGEFVEVAPAAPNPDTVIEWQLVGAQRDIAAMTDADLEASMGPPADPVAPDEAAQS